MSMGRCRGQRGGGRSSGPGSPQEGPWEVGVPEGLSGDLLRGPTVAAREASPGRSRLLD